jgi:hypothetical protein
MTSVFQEPIRSNYSYILRAGPCRTLESGPTGIALRVSFHFLAISLTQKE